MNVPHPPYAVLQTTSVFCFDQREAGWTLIKNPRFRNVETHFHLIDFFENKESCIGWDTFIQRAKKIQSLAGQLHAERLMKHKRIPVEWCQFFLVFPGTVWRNDSGRFCSPFLHWNGTRWDISWHWSNIPFHPRAKIVTAIIIG